MTDALESEPPEVEEDPLLGPDCMAIVPFRTMRTGAPEHDFAEIFPDDAQSEGMYFLFPFRPCFFWSFFVDSPFFSGITAPAALRRLEELFSVE